MLTHAHTQNYIQMRTDQYYLHVWACSDILSIKFVFYMLARSYGFVALRTVTFLIIEHLV